MMVKHQIISRCDLRRLLRFRRAGFGAWAGGCEVGSDIAGANHRWQGRATLATNARGVRNIPPDEARRTRRRIGQGLVATSSLVRVRERAGGCSERCEGVESGNHKVPHAQKKSPV
jgi:hypothetical protein